MTPNEELVPCDSCWVLFEREFLEGDGFFVTGNMSPFNEQQPVNCDSVDSGCNGAR